MKKKLILLLASLTVFGMLGAATACDAISGVLGGSSVSSSSSSSEEPVAKEYTVTFSADGIFVGSVKYTEGATSIEEPAVPEKAHYTGAWQAYELNGNVTVNAVYTAIEYTATFMVNGEAVGTAKYSLANPVVEQPVIPEKPHYTGTWANYELKGGDVTINAVYKPISYKVTFVADGETVSTQSYTIEDLENLNIVEPEVPGKPGFKGVWETYSVEGGDVTVNAVYTEVYTASLNFDNLTEVPSYLKKGDATESLSLVEMNGSKVLRIKAGTNADPAAKSSPALVVTIEFLATFFEDPNVDYIAFDATSGESSTTNFRRDTERVKPGTTNELQFVAVTYEADLGITPIKPGITANMWKTFYFSRTDYEMWQKYGKTESRFIAAGEFIQGDSIYVDNFRPVTEAERTADIYGFENGGVRLNDNDQTLLFYSFTSDWTFNIQVESGKKFTNVGFTNQYVTNGLRALQFTKDAGTLNINFTSAKVGYTDVVTKTGYWAVDVYVPEGADTTVNYQYIKDKYIPGVTLKAGAWSTIYVSDSRNQLTFKDTTGGAYVLDNIRSISQKEYQMGGLSFEANASSIRAYELSDTTNSNPSYIYTALDNKKNVFTFAMCEGNGKDKDGNPIDVQAVSNVRYDSEIVKDGTYSLAFEKGKGYMYITMRADSTAYELLKDGFTFWIYSTTRIDGTTTSMVNGANNKFNGGEGIVIEANTWTKVTVTAEDMNPTRFLILQGNWEGTIYLDGFEPLA